MPLTEEQKEFVRQNYKMPRKELSKIIGATFNQVDYFCRRNRLLTDMGKISLVEKRPELLEEWDYNKNQGIDPLTISFGCNKKVWWLCLKGHSYEVQINKRCNGDKTNCPYCANKCITNENSLATRYPELLSSWDYDKNDISPEKVIGKSRKEFYWKCDKGHSWKISADGRIRTYERSGLRCPYCSQGKEVAENNSMYYCYPELLLTWNYSRNQDDPKKISKSSSKNKYYWICEKGHSFLSTVNGRIQKGKIKGCPYCTNRFVCKDNSLSDNYPEISKEWCFDKNGGLTPEQVLYNSSKIYWWICRNDNNHIWQASVYRRTRENSQCPYCVNRKVDQSNCVANTHPELIEEWSETNKLSPYDLVYGSGERIDWICKKCKKNWTCALKSRTNKKKGTGCPYCINSVGENRIEEFLINKNIDFSRQFTLDGCKNIKKLRFDFCVNINNKILLIEYNGKQHYKYDENMYKYKIDFENVKKRDKIKINYCKKNNIPLLVIPYWDFNKIEELILDFIKQQC